MAALSPATCIPTEPQVQPRTLLTCRNCQATFTSRNRLHKHLRFDCCSTITKNAVKSTITSTSTTSSSLSLQSFDYVQQQIARHLNDLRLRSQHVYHLSNRQPKNTSLFSTSSLSSRATATIFLHACHDPFTRPQTTSQFCKSTYLRLHQNRTLSAKAHPLTSKFKICQRILLLLQTHRKPLQSNQLF
jgi:hypothetical protein